MSLHAKGLYAWLIQRVSAVYLLLVLGWFLYVLVISPPQSYAQWHAWFSNPLINAGALLFFLMLFAHAWVGLRDVVMDYVYNDIARITVLILLASTLIFLGLWVLRTLVLLV